MCCWSIRVTATVTGNLVLRFCAELTDAVYTFLLTWWCSSAICKYSAEHATLKTNAWYICIDRQAAESLLQSVKADGVFLIRPSSKPDNVCTLSVWQDEQIFHINVRRRPDGWLALGKNKPNEHCFATVQDMVDFYKNETLVISSGGAQYLTVLQEKQLIIVECSPLSC